MNVITPGPWHKWLNDNATQLLIGLPNREIVAIVNLWHGTTDKLTAELNAKAHANAAVITAAPKLLAELERMYEAARCMADPEHCLHEQREHLPWLALANQARAAIVEAGG